MASNLKKYLSAKDIVWDVGTGSGVQAIVARQYTRNVIASDLNPHALKALTHNCKLNQITPTVPSFLGSFDGALRPLLHFSRILFNPPYLVSPTNDVLHPKKPDQDYWLGRAWNGGEKGFSIIQQFLSGLPHHLITNGIALMIHAQTDKVLSPLLKQFAHQNNLQIKEISRRSFFYEHLFLTEITYKENRG